MVIIKVDKNLSAFWRVFLLGGYFFVSLAFMIGLIVFSPVSYTHLRAHETREDLVFRLVR